MAEVVREGFCSIFDSLLGRVIGVGSIVSSIMCTVLNILCSIPCTAKKPVVTIKEDCNEI